MKLLFSELASAVGGTLKNAPADGFVSCVSTDSRQEIPNGLFIAIPGERFDGHNFLGAALKNGANLLCVEEESLHKLPPGAPALVVKSTQQAYLDAARFYKNSFPELKVVALSGSSGKTSTKEMLRAIFAEVYGADHVLATEGNTNNQIGVPYNLFRLNENHKIAVIETGTNHFGEIQPLAKTIEPDAAVIVSIGRCHLENFFSLEGVAAEKSDLFRSLKPGGTAVIPAGCPQNPILAKAAFPCNVVTAGEEEGDVFSIYLGGNMEGSSFLLKDTRTGEVAKVDWYLSGAHQASNAALAAAVAKSFGIPLKTIARGLENCSLPGLRMKKSTHLGATWINDAYNANPDSMRATLTWLSEFATPDKVLPVLGDMLETGENAAQVHKEILEYALELFPLAKILAVGPLMTNAAKELASEQIISFPDSDSCAGKIADFVIPEGLVFLKASRGTHLEKVEPQ